MEKIPTYSLIQKNGYTFAIVYSSKCVSVFLNQTIDSEPNEAAKLNPCFDSNIQYSVKKTKKKLEL